jgi:hypothetical protein
LEGFSSSLERLGHEVAMTTKANFFSSLRFGYQVQAQPLRIDLEAISGLYKLHLSKSTNSGAPSELQPTLQK